MIYCFNVNTGEYSMTMPFETKEGEGRTTIEPPETGENETAVFDTESQTWSVYADYRFTHKMVKDNTVYNIEDLGEIPDGYTLITNAEAQEVEEQLKIANLTMTPLDFINFLVEAGLTLEQINTYLEANLNVKMQLTYCSNVYCSVAKALMPITVDDVTITADMVEAAFVEKNA